jgi:hypothetical protein
MEKNDMNRTVLKQPFEPGLIKTRRGAFGKTLSYVEGAEYIRRLNEAFEGEWCFEIVGHQVHGTEVVVIGMRVGLTYRLWRGPTDDEGVWAEVWWPGLLDSVRFHGAPEDPHVELVEAAPIRRVIKLLEAGKNERAKHVLEHACPAIIDIPPIELVRLLLTSSARSRPPFKSSRSVLAPLGEHREVGHARRGPLGPQPSQRSTSSRPGTSIEITASRNLATRLPRTLSING